MATLLGRRASGQQAAFISHTVPVLPCTARRVLCRRSLTCCSTAPGFEKSLFGEDWGARDPTPGEIGSNFGEKIVMNWDTEHIIKPPDAMGEHVGLTSRRCRPVDELALLDENIRERLRQQVPGWRITALPGGEQQCIRQDWTASDADAAAALLARLHGVAESQGHAPVRAEAVGSTVILELSTPAVGGLTENDFVVAAHINGTDLTDLLAKRKARFWA